MKIHHLSDEEIEDFLSHASLGRIACESEGQPYIASAYLSADGGYLYGFSAVGQKICWMRANPRVCVQFEEIDGTQNWTTVVVTGIYEELTNTPERQRLRDRAYALLQRRAMWWEPALVKPDCPQGSDRAEFVYFRIRIDRKTGRRCVAEEKTQARENWIRRIFRARDI